MIIDTLSPAGSPWCPVCHEPVDREGEFDEYLCWLHFHVLAFNQGGVIEMGNLIDMHDQPWYNDGPTFYTQEV